MNKPRRKLQLRGTTKKNSTTEREREREREEKRKKRAKNG
jgi:hypothetical protein